jgi:hypothetical protein
MVYLIGVDHINAQRKKRGAELSDCQLKFRIAIEATIESLDPSLLAEEDHPDFLSGPDVPPDNISDSILLEIAKVKGIENRHRFVDPNDAERERIGYRQLNGPPWDAVLNRAHEIMHQFPIHEEFWLQKLQGSLDSNVLFVCGWGHIESFTAQLTTKGVGCYVWADKIGANTPDLKFDVKVRKYIKNHRTEFNKSDCSCLR